MKSARIPKKYLHHLTLAFHLSAFFLSLTAHAARPFVTDDARIVDPGGCQVETFYKDQRTYAGSEFWFMPACTPKDLGIEITAGGNRVEDQKNAIAQLKFLLKPLQTNGSGFAVSAGVYGTSPYVNTIASFSTLNDRAVFHVNAGAIRDKDTDSLRNTWGAGLEALLWEPRVYGIFETYGISSETPTYHVGLRFWIIPNRFQIDATHGTQKAFDSDPERRFNSVGLRILW
jgi:hypothetical protein